MSRIGLKPLPLPKGVAVSVAAEQAEIKGPKGRLSVPIPPGISIDIAGDVLRVARASDEKPRRALHGLTRALLANAVQGVSRGFVRHLDIVGIGYRAEVKGKTVVFALGYSHPVEYPIPEGITVAIEKQTRVTVSGIDRQKVGQVAAEIRRLRRPDPYKQKGIRYVGEVLKKKAGKAGATGAK